MHGHLEQELAHLKERLLQMAVRAEAATRQAIQAFAERDHDLAIRVKEQDSILDRFEVEIDNEAIHILAKAPLAGDLRFVTVAMKISQNLERVGDEAAKIAKRARDLSKEPPLKLNLDLKAMADLALSMLKRALDAFVESNPAAARAVLPMDQQVDAMHKQIRRALVEHMQQYPETIPQCLDVLTAAKCLERIADHATNIAEDVVYMCEALDIRHAPKSSTSAANDSTR